jgi:hypothetical protein
VNAQNGNDKVEDAVVRFKQDGQTVADTTSNSVGRYTAELGEGDYTMEVVKGGWITLEKPVQVKGPIRKGQGADAALSMVLPPGGYRVVLNWGAHSRDLDSWTYFDRNYKKYVYYGRTAATGANSGVTVNLDWDDVDGYGPETTTFMGVGTCTESCLVKFHVDNYSRRDAPLGESEAEVTLYHGDGVLKRFSIPTDAGSSRGWTVFTLDASSEPANVLEGDWNYGPYLLPIAGQFSSTEWGASMDTEGWSKVAAGSVLYGMTTSSLDNLHQVSKGLYYYVQNTKPSKETFTEVDWTGVLEGGGTATCPDGTWITGLYRTGSRFAPPSGGHQISKAVCSSFEGAEAWGKCVDHDIFEQTGEEAAKCPLIDGKASAMVGFHHVGASNSDKLNGLDMAKCCTFPDSLVRNEDESKLCIATQSCVGLLGKQ